MYSSGQGLLKFHAFANVIKTCDAVLKPYDISVTDILMKTDKKVYHKVLYTFVGIIAIQVNFLFPFYKLFYKFLILLKLSFLYLN